MILWSSAWAFLLLIPLVGFAVYWFLKKSKVRPTMQFSSLAVLKELAPGWRSRLAPLPLILKFLALALAVMALARPQRADEKIQKNVEGIDIMFALDISDSMLIEDMKPLNRLESAKRTIAEFSGKRVSDRMGLVVFSGESYTRVPLTLDYELLQSNLKSVQTTRNIKMGTALGVALANAAARLKESTAESRVIVFLTDGENNSGTIDPLTALDIVKGYGIRVYTIGVGRDGQTRIPVISKDSFGRQVKRYQPFYSKVNESLLQRMAKDTGGKYYRAESTNVLEKVFSDIDRLEKSKIDINRYTRYTELFPAWLAAAVLTYLLSIALNRTVLARGP